MARTQGTSGTDLEFIANTVASLPALERLPDMDPALLLNRFLNRIIENCDVDACLVLVVSRETAAITARIGVTDSAAESVADLIKEKSMPSAAQIESRVLADCLLVPILTLSDKDCSWQVLPYRLPGENTMFVAFAASQDITAALGMSLRILGGQIASILTVFQLASSVAAARDELDEMRQEVKEMQVSSLNIMEDLQNKNRELGMLNEIARKMASWRNLPELVQKAAEAASGVLDGAQVVMFSYDDDRESLRPYQASNGVDLNLIVDCSIPADHPMMEAIANGREAMVDRSGDTFDLAAAKELGLKTGLILPLLSNGDLLGFLLVCESRWHRVFTDGEMENLRVLTSAMAVAMENTTLMSRLAAQVGEMSILKEYIETVVDSVDLGIMVVDSTLKITMFNRGFERVFGYKKQDFIGKQIFEVFPHLVEQGFTEVVRQVFSGKPFIRYAWKRKLLDGSVAIQNFRVFPHRDSTGRIIGGIAIIEDVTEKANLEDQLAKSEAKFSRLVEDLDDGYIIVADGKVAYANKAVSHLTGTPVHEVIGIGLDKIIADPDLVTECTSPAENRLTRETKINHSTGTWIPVEVGISTCEYGGTQAVSIILRDITERRKIEKQLEDKNREMRLRNEQITRLNLELEETLNKLKASQENLIQSERVAAITETSIAANHEINNPLFAILGQAQLLLRTSEDLDEGMVKRLKSIEESALRIACVTKKLANLADPVVKEYSGLAAKMIDVDRSISR
jgi:PAS domain S-box-containing protein